MPSPQPPPIQEEPGIEGTTESPLDGCDGNEGLEINHGVEDFVEGEINHGVEDLVEGCMETGDGGGMETDEWGGIV